MYLSSYLATYLSRDSQKSLIGFELMKQPKLALLSIGEPCRFNCLSFPSTDGKCMPPCLYFNV